MTDEQMESLVSYRMSQAHESLAEAQILLDASALRGVVNHTYYAMFYAVLAPLTIRQIGTSRHSGIISLFDREFVKTGALSRDLSRSLHLAFDRRQMHDYGEMMPADRQMASGAVADESVFVAAVERHLRSTGHLVDSPTAS